MRVTFLAINYSPSVGGSQTLVRCVAEGLAADGSHSVTVVTTDAVRAPAGSDPGRLAPGFERIGGVEVVRGPVARRLHTMLRRIRALGSRLGRPARPGTLAYGPFGARLGIAAWRAIGDADVVVGVSAPFATVPIGGLMSSVRSRPFVAVPLLHLGDWEPRRWLVRSLGRADLVVAVTESERDWLTARGVDPQRVVVIPVGCDQPSSRRGAAEARRRAGLADGPTVVCFGRLAPQKGIDTLLVASADLLREHPDLTVVIAGAATGWTGMTQLLEALGSLAERVVVRTDVSDAERDDLLAAADVVALPSREESFGLVMVEAWAAGSAVVVSDLPAVRSAARPGEDAILVPPGDAVSLSRVIATLLADEDARERLGSAGRRRVSEEFSWERVVARWADELESAVATAAGPLDRGAA